MSPGAKMGQQRPMTGDRPPRTRDDRNRRRMRAGEGDRRARKKIAKKERLCLEEHAVYAVTDGKCSPCDPCGYGKGRVFPDVAEVTRGPDGGHQCPPCQECPDDSYNSQRKAVVCSPCVVSCHIKHRHVASTCTKLHDATCGSCLPGFIDDYGHTDFPCIKSKVTRPTTEASHNASSKVQNPDPDNKGYAVGGVASGPLTTGFLDPGWAMALTVLGCLAGLILLTVFLIWVTQKVRERRTVSGTRQNDGLLGSAVASRSSLTHDNDIEMDAVDVDDVNTDSTGERLALYQREHSREGNFPYHVTSESTAATIVPHPELSVNLAEHRPGPRPELPGAYRSQPEAIRTQSPCPVSPCPQMCSRKHCSCDLHRKCHCSGSLDACPKEPILKGSETLREVATNICHNPVTLYLSLGIPEAAIYQIDNDRDRDPERIPEKENIMKLLNRWIEINAKGATRQALCKALCDSGFHSITVKLCRREI